MKPIWYAFKPEVGEKVMGWHARHARHPGEVLGFPNREQRDKHIVHNPKCFAVTCGQIRLMGHCGVFLQGSPESDAMLDWMLHQAQTLCWL